MFLCAIDLNIGIFVDFSDIVLLYQLCVSSSRRHNDTQQTCFVKCKDIFQTKISLKLFMSVIPLPLLAVFGFTIHTLPLFLSCGLEVKDFPWDS